MEFSQPEEVKLKKFILKLYSLIDEHNSDIDSNVYEAKRSRKIEIPADIKIWVRAEDERQAEAKQKLRLSAKAKLTPEEYEAMRGY